MLNKWWRRKQCLTNQNIFNRYISCFIYFLIYGKIAQKTANISRFKLIYVGLQIKE